jgi:hypothetical protein
MNVEIGAEATLFPVKEYINRIAVAVHVRSVFCAKHIVKEPNIFVSMNNGFLET